MVKGTFVFMMYLINLSSLTCSIMRYMNKYEVLCLINEKFQFILCDPI